VDVLFPTAPGMTCNGRYWAAKGDVNNATVVLMTTPWLVRDKFSS